MPASRVPRGSSISQSRGRRTRAWRGRRAADRRRRAGRDGVRRGGTAAPARAGRRPVPGARRGRRRRIRGENRRSRRRSGAGTGRRTGRRSRRRAGLAGGPSTCSPAIRICPLVGASRPASMRRVVVLPQPEGPRRTTNSPSSQARSMPATASTPPGKVLVNPSISRKLIPPSRTGRALPAGIRPGLHAAGHDMEKGEGRGDEETPAEARGPPGLQHHRDSRGEACPRQEVEAADHRFIVPRVTPLSRCRRTSTVKRTIGSTNSSTPAPICDQGRPWTFPCSPAK